MARFRDRSSQARKQSMLSALSGAIEDSALIARFGVLRVMLAGVGLLTGHVLLTLSGTGLASFASAPVLLGVGWNFLYIGGATLLTETYNEVEKGRAQATNDMTIFGVSLFASLSAGLLHQHFGWQTLNLLLLPWLGMAALALIWLAAARLRTRQMSSG